MKNNRCVVEGSRIHWDGDMKNAPGDATVTALAGFHMALAFDDGRIMPGVPVMIIDSPRWHVLAA